ncbi:MULTISPECIES: hypothetical protein [Streptomyces]|uniref:LysR family transcriptional regulator n=1 Tax=Streptomyces doebereineriae TaxID=3075528 RepID=A0ABU2V1L4_9ACTN|nr:hypothetical protein [Streptomyces sp. DSM 41640]MDT0479026.1 hypothetical protein [Streptomyces sp. DSM 41640]
MCTSMAGGVAVTGVAVVRKAVVEPLRWIAVTPAWAPHPSRGVVAWSAAFVEFAEQGHG